MSQQEQFGRQGGQQFGVSPELSFSSTSNIGAWSNAIPTGNTPPEPMEGQMPYQSLLQAQNNARTLEAAVEFTNNVKLYLQEMPDELSKYFKIMLPIARNEPFIMSDMICKICTILKDDRDLLNDFNGFLPNEYQITVTYDGQVVIAGPGM